jgi:hypothetical protein
MNADYFSKVDRYVTPDGTVCDAPKGLEEDSRGRLFLNQKAVNVGRDGKLTPANERPHAAAAPPGDALHRRVSCYVVEPSLEVVEVSRGAALSQTPDGGVFYNGRSVADRQVAPVVEAEGKLFLARPNASRQEVELVEGRAIPVADGLHVAAADTAGALRPKTERHKGRREGLSIQQGDNPISSFLQNFLHNYRAARKGREVKESVTDVKNLIAWEEAEKMGLTKDFLQRGGHLEKMLQGRKTDLLPIAITDKESGVAITTYARLSLKQDAEGKIRFAANLLRSDLDLTQCYGHRLTDEDRANLQGTGNLGRAIEVKLRGDEHPKTLLLSLDRQTNELVAFDAKKVKVPQSIAGRALTPEQRQALGEGKPVKLEGVRSEAGKEFSDTLQFSALERRFVFTGGLPIGRKIAGVELSDEQRHKIVSGEGVQLVGMTDKAGKKYDAYVRWNPGKKKLDFSHAPDFSRKKVTPANEYKTQVAANNDGHKPKALENVQGPAEQRQPNTPTAAQAAKQKQAAKRGARKGVRV